MMTGRYRSQQPEEGQIRVLLHVHCGGPHRNLREARLCQGGFVMEGIDTKTILVDNPWKDQS